MTTRPRGVSFPARREDDGAAGQCLDSAGAVDHFEFRIVKRVMGAGEEANTLSHTHTRHPIPTARGPLSLSLTHAIRSRLHVVRVRVGAIGPVCSGRPRALPRAC